MKAFYSDHFVLPLPENGRAVAAFEAAVKAHSRRKVKFLNATGVSDGRYYADDGIETLRDELPCGDLPDDVWPETLHWTPMQGAKGWTAEVSR